MKLSISLDDADLDRLDQILEREGLGTRSATVQQAIRARWEFLLGDAYQDAWDEWESSGDRPSWDTVNSDGLNDEAW